MKTKLFTLFLALAASVGTMFAQGTKIGNLYYNLNATNKTAEVTYKSYANYRYNEGWNITTANIPASVTYSGTTYSVTSIGYEAFAWCSSLTSVTIPNSVTSIGQSAFDGCSSLTSVTIPNSVTSVGEAALAGCSSLTSVTIPNSVTSIGSLVFYYCSSLTSVTIPNSVTSIGEEAFAWCSSLTYISVATNNQNYSSKDGVLFDKQQKTLIQCPGGKQGAYVIPNSVTSIGERAFCYCSNLTSVTIPNSVTSIGKEAFRDCSTLTSVTIPNSVTSIGEYAFYGCSSLTDIYVCGDLERFQQLLNNDDRIKVGMPYSITINAEHGNVSCPQTMCDDMLLNATPDYGYHFVKWSDGNTDNPRTFVLTRDTTFTAQFAPDQYTLSLQCNENQGTVEGAGVFDYLTQVQISATPAYGYHFSSWSDGNTANPRTITLTKDVALTANFAPNKYSINVSCNAEQGSVKGSGSYIYLSNRTIEATSNYGYHFKQWSDGNTDNPRTIELTQDTTFTVEFAKNTYTISTTSANPEWGTTAGGKSALYQDEVEISATPNYGYHFVQWSDGNTSNPRTISVTEDKAFTAIFAEDTYLVKIEDVYYNLNVPDKTAEVCGFTGKIRIYDNSIDDWNMLPAQYVAQATCPADAAYTGLKSVKVYADTKYINILVEPNMDDLPDLSYVPFHVYLNTDNSDDTGGYGDLFTDANSDILLEGALFSDNNPCIYAPFVFKWWGEVGGDGWAWQDPNVGHDKSDCWGAIVCEGQLQGCSSQYVDGKFEIQIDRTYIPATWNNTAFGIGVEILQSNWDWAGFLPCVSSTDDDPYGKTAKLQVTIHNTPDAEISGDIAIPETVNYDGVTYSVTSIGDGAFYGCTGLTSVTIEAETPPTLGSNAFYNTNNCPIYVPCNAASAYKSAWPGYANRIKYAQLPYKVYTVAENGNVTTTDVTTLTICDPFVTCTATPDYGYHFTQWSDGNTDNPRTIELRQDTTLEAIFAVDKYGTCGDNLQLTWRYDTGSKTLTISGEGDLTTNMRYGVEAVKEMKELVIEDGVGVIGNEAFANIKTLNTITLGKDVRKLQERVFYNCYNLTAIYNYRKTPASATSNTFEEVDKYACTIYVLAGSEDMFRSATGWKDFYSILAIGATETTVTDKKATVEPSDNSATVTWPVSNEAASYTIDITKDGVVFCRLTFNANGQLTGIAFAPGRDGQSMAPAAVMTANGLQFTVTGLNSGTQYGYSLTAKDANEQPIATYSGSFTTTSEGVHTGIDNTPFLSGEGRGEASKLLRNGEVLILRDGKTYTIQGVEVK